MKNDVREQRVSMRLPVRVWGMDTAGKLFSVEAYTLDITPRGARIQGDLAFLEKGAVVGIQCGRSRSRFRVAWSRHGQIGVQCVEPGKYIWGVPLERKLRGTVDEVQVSGLALRLRAV
jgi:hypothetical protein